MKMLCLAASLVTVCGVQFTSAQAPGTNPAKRPAFSPWLNLNRQGNSATLNYYGLVRPQVSVNNSLQNLEQQTTTLQQQESGPASAELPPTGHASGFLNHNKYFFNRGGATPSGGNTTPPTAKLAAPRKTR